MNYLYYLFLKFSKASITFHGIDYKDCVELAKIHMNLLFYYYLHLINLDRYYLLLETEWTS